jgi:peptide/nickel transport system substrate-binding protein
MKHGRLLTLVVLVVTAVTACVGPGPGGPPRGNESGATSAPSGPKRVVAGVLGAHSTLNTKSTGPGRPPGYDAIEALVSAGLANVSDRGTLRPQLAEAVPSIENGLWRVFPDGRMETTWRIRPNAEWHDGTPFTTRDLLFTADVVQDPALPNFRDSAFALIDSLTAPDDRTLVASWSQPYIGADAMFTNVHIVPLPRHVLERAYQESKATFTDLPFWRNEFVGTGPFKVQSWTLGSGAVFAANDRFVLGRPKVDVVEVKFITDSSALVASLLSGDVELTMGRGFSIEQALQVRDQWKHGRVDTSYESWIANYPQMLNPNPSVLLDVRFRRALLLAIDRQEMVETIQHGLVPVADTLLDPGQPEFPAIESSIVKYPHDPRAAARTLAELGYARGGDGVFRDASGQRLLMDIQATSGDINEKSMASVADYWQRMGIPTDTYVIPPARTNDREFRNTRPGFELQRQPNAPEDLDRYHSSQVPLHENNFTGTSKSRYANAELDGLINAYFATIPTSERVSVLGRIIHHISDQVVPVPLYYDASTAMIGNRLQNVTARKGRNSNEAWNVELWDVTR